MAQWWWNPIFLKLHNIFTSHGIELSFRSILRSWEQLGWTFQGSAYCQLICYANKLKHLDWVQRHIWQIWWWIWHANLEHYLLPFIWDKFPGGTHRSIQGTCNVSRDCSQFLRIKPNQLVKDFTWVTQFKSIENVAWTFACMSEASYPGRTYCRNTFVLGHSDSSDNLKGYGDRR